MKSRRQGQSQVLSNNEVKRMIQFQKTGKHSTRNICLINFAFFLGARVGEIAQLKIKDVVDKNWTIKEEVVLQKEYCKTNKSRVLYLVNKDLRKSLEQYILFRKSADKKNEIRKVFDRPLFLSQKGSGFTPRTLQRMVKNMMRAVGLDEMKSSHSFRRTFITNLISQGIDLKTVSTLAGHSSVQTTVDIYAVANPNKMKNVCNSISL